MTQIEPVFVVNPIINQYKKKYILGVDSNAAAIFKELCTRRIYIDGFIDDKNAGIYFFHKHVYAFHELELYKNDAILLMHDSRSDIDLYPICFEICILNPKLYNKKAFVYGTRCVEEKIFSILQDKGIETVGFIDSDKIKIGTFIENKAIYEKDTLGCISDDTVLIMAGVECNKIGETADSIHHIAQKFYVDELPFELDDVWVDRKHKHKITTGSIAELQEYLNREEIAEIILYGNNLQLAQKYAEIYRCLDFWPVSFMVDKKDYIESDAHFIDEIIYKDKYLILWYEEKELPYDMLSALGVSRRYYGRTYPWHVPNLNTRNILLDVNMGYTYQMNSEYPGIYVYGEDMDRNYKIAVLGGSTTDSMLDSQIRSWVEIMHDKYCQPDIVIYNGGIAGYSSDQELMKLIRDMMKLNPDMVIVYDGYNDLMQEVLGKKYVYLRELVNFAGQCIPTCSDEMLMEKEANMGVLLRRDPVQVWLENIEYMYAIAKSKNIKFVSFMQPMLFTKKRMDKHSKSIFQTMLFHGKNQEFLDVAKRFRESAGKIESMHDYIHDLTGIFDDADVYMDIVHVNEKGNEIIAESIWKQIKDSIP